MPARTRNSVASGDGSCAGRGCRPESQIRHHSPLHSRLFMDALSCLWSQCGILHGRSLAYRSGAAGLVFPAGYVTLNLLGLEMVTGSFAMMPIGIYAGTFTLVSWFATGSGSGGQSARRHLFRLADLVLFYLRRDRSYNPCPPSSPTSPNISSLCSVRRDRLVHRHRHGFPL